MTKLIIAIYEKNLNRFTEENGEDHANAKLITCTNLDSLDSMIEKIQLEINNYDSYVILTDEEGGTPFLASLIASAKTDTQIFVDEDFKLFKKFIKAHSIKNDIKFNTYNDENIHINAIY